VAVAAGLVPAAIGTDTGGSVRVPAALTGIYGLKVTHGRVPVAGVFPLAPSLDTVGPLSRDAATLDLVYRALAGLGGTAAPHPMEGVRVGLPEQWLDCPDLDALTRQEFDQTASALEKAGAELVRIDDPVLVPWGMIQELAGAEAAASHRAFRAAGRPYGAEVSDRLDKAETVTMEEYISAHRWRTTLVEAFARAFHIVDVLATPAVASRRKVIGDDRINGSHYRPVLSWFSALVNHAGAPAIAIPWLGREPGSRADGSRPPFSLQLVAPPWQEDRLLGLARGLEEAGMAGFTRPPVYLE
jgi:aspartyl-tRNA(Asn)/glutamyl-tRNA(Gln) amidotransferase subunit A